MRVLHINAGNLYGGVETLLVTLARFRGLSPSVEPEFALCWAGRLSEELLGAGVKVHILGPVRLRNALSMWRARRQLAKLLSDAHFDAIICHMPWSQAVFGPVARQAKLPLVFWMHGKAKGSHWLEYLARLTPPDFAICNSYFVSDSLKHLYRRTASAVFYYPISPSSSEHKPAERSTKRLALGSSPDAVVIVQSSRFDGWKGHCILIEALATLRDSDKWDCWIVGGPQRPSEKLYLQQLKQIASGLGVFERIRFLGERSAVDDLLVLADIYCQPNTEAEPFGISFVEALYAGLPVVTSRMGGAMEVVDEDCGVLVPPGNVDAVASALNSLIRDPLLRRRLGAAAPARADRISNPRKRMIELQSILERIILDTSNENPSDN